MDKAAQRLFFALWPEDSCRTALAAAMRHVQEKIPARWIKPENLHITLAFLGNVDAGQRGRLASLAGDIQAQAGEFLLDRIEHWRKPQVLCLTPSTAAPMLDQLAADLTIRLKDAGYQLDQRPFRAHLTLARKATSLPEGIRLERPIVWQSTAFVLVESTRNGQGSDYTVLESWPL